MVGEARRRARKFRLPFDLTVDDIEIPDVCPILGLRLKTNRHIPGPNSPSLDRIVPERGYVRGNVIVISHRANMIRGNATLDELRRVFEFYQKRLWEDECLEQGL